MSTTHAKAKLMVCSLRSPISPPQYISLLSISASALLMTLQRFGMICLMMYVRPLLSTHSEGSSKPISSHKHIRPDFSSPSFVSVALTLAMSQVYDYRFLLLFGVPGVCLWIEIGRYKNTIRIRINMCTFSKNLYYPPWIMLTVPMLKYRSIYHPKFSFDIDPQHGSRSLYYCPDTVFSLLQQEFITTQEAYIHLFVVLKHH